MNTKNRRKPAVKPDKAVTKPDKAEDFATIQERVLSLTRSRPLLTAPMVARQVGCSPSYVRSLWNEHLVGIRKLVVYLRRENLEWLIAECLKVKGSSLSDMLNSIIDDARAGDK